MVKVEKRLQVKTHMKEIINRVNSMDTVFIEIYRDLYMGQFFTI